MDVPNGDHSDLIVVYSFPLLTTESWSVAAFVAGVLFPAALAAFCIAAHAIPPATAAAAFLPYFAGIALQVLLGPHLARQLARTEQSEPATILPLHGYVLACIGTGEPSVML
jgi:hypothetical protein